MCEDVVFGCNSRGLAQGKFAQPKQRVSTGPPTQKGTLMGKLQRQRLSFFRAQSAKQLLPSPPHDSFSLCVRSHSKKPFAHLVGFSPLSPPMFLTLRALSLSFLNPRHHCHCQATHMCQHTTTLHVSILNMWKTLWHKRTQRVYNPKFKTKPMTRACSSALV